MSTIVPAPAGWYELTVWEDWGDDPATTRPIIAFEVDSEQGRWFVLHEDGVYENDRHWRDSDHTSVPFHESHPHTDEDVERMQRRLAHRKEAA